MRRKGSPMAERLEPILPQVPVEGLALHIGRSGISLGDPAEAQLLPDGRVGIFARIRRPFLGLVPVWRQGYLGHLGPIAEQILGPALAEGVNLRLRIVLLTPEHLAGSGPPEVVVSIWGEPTQLAPYLDLPSIYLPSAPPPETPAGA